MTATAYPTSTSQFQHALSLPNHPPLLMLTMGKVASKSIGRSLEGLYPGAIAHAHSTSLNKNCPPGQIGPHHPDKRFRLLWHHIQDGHPTKIIAPVRQSLDRNISDFFENFNAYTHKPQDINQFHVEHLETLFYAYQPHLRHAFWFDLHLLPLTDINVYHHPAHAHNIHNKNNFSVLVFRTEETDSYKSQAIASFLNLQLPLPIHPHNRASQKPYQTLYLKFRTHFSPTQGYLQALDHTTYSKHFYPAGWAHQNWSPHWLHQSP